MHIRLTQLARAILPPVLVVGVLVGVPADNSGAAASVREGGENRVIVLFESEPFEGTGEPSAASASRSMMRMSSERAGFLERMEGLNAGGGDPFRFDFRSLLNGIAVTLSDADLATARSLPGVTIFEDNPVHLALETSVPLVGADQAWAATGATGAGTTIAVVDTGVDYTHPDLGACLGAGCKVVAGYDFVNLDTDPIDDNGHGTHVAGIAAADGDLKGVAPGANILAYKALDAYGSGWDSTLIAAIEAAADPDGDPATKDGADVINLSVGGFGGPDAPLSMAADAAVRAGSTVVAAAGNIGLPKYIESPGSARDAITVGASDDLDAVASFSARGPAVSRGIALFKPDIVAPGVDICSTRAEVSALGIACRNGGHELLSGTSMSTPHVAGAVAILLELHPDWSPLDAKMALRNTAVELGDVPLAQGFGRLDVFAASQLPHAPPSASITTSGPASGLIDIMGTAAGENFESYSLLIGKGEQPADWTLISESTAPVEGGVLAAEFNAYELPEGYSTLRLDVRSTDGLVSTDRALLESDQIHVASPLSGDFVRSGEAIRFEGTIEANPSFLGYSLEWGQGLEPVTWTDSGFALAAAVPGTGVQLLGTWDTSVAPPDGDVTVRLVVRYSWGESEEFVQGLNLSSMLKAGWPQRVAADSVRDCPVGEYCTYWVGPLVPVVADLDLDGSKEVIVIVGGEPPTVEVYNHDGSLAWSAPVGVGGVAGGNLSVPLVADITGDRRMEVIVHGVPGVYWQSEVHAFASDGSPVPGWPVQLPPAFHAALIAGDVYGDAKQEIIVKVNDGQPRRITVLGGAGDIISDWPLPPSGMGSFSERTPALGNFDGDADLEIVSVDIDAPVFDPETEQPHNKTSVHVYNVGGAEVPGWPREVDGLATSSPAVGDLDADGREEIIVAGGDYFTDHYPDPRFGGLYAFDRTGELLPGWPVEKGQVFVSSPSVGDLDLDGDLEIAASGLGSTYLFHHDGTVASGWPQYTPGWDVFSTYIADIDSNGSPDVLTKAEGGRGFVVAWTAGGAWLDQLLMLNTEPSWVGTGIAIADLDGNDRVDIVATSNDDSFFPSQLYKSRGSIYVWELSSAPPNACDAWPQFLRDASHSGRHRPDAVDCFLAVKGDLDCNSKVDVADSLSQLRYVAGLAVEQAEPCDDVGSGSPFIMGDVDCDASISAIDALFLQRYVAGLPVILPESCPAIGEPYAPTSVADAARIVHHPGLAPPLDESQFRRTTTLCEVAGGQSPLGLLRCPATEFLGQPRSFAVKLNWRMLARRV